MARSEIPPADASRASDQRPVLVPARSSVDTRSSVDNSLTGSVELDGGRF